MSADAAAGGHPATALALAATKRPAGFAGTRDEYRKEPPRRFLDTALARSRKPEEAPPTRSGRAASEGCTRRRAASTGKAGPVRPRAVPSTRGCMWVDERSQVQELLAVKPRGNTTPKGRHGTSQPLVPSVQADAADVGGTKPSPRDSEIYDQVSSLVEELEAARARALAAGGSLPRAVEAAGSALEPLLRLRDVTGASCDLTLMPWLPQLLTVFRHVLRTAVGGAGSRSSEPLWATNADSGAGGGGSAQGAAAAAAAHAAAAAAAAISALGAPLDPSGAQRLECDALRVQVREQDSELRAAKQREEELRRELEELRAERRGLLHSASEGGNWFAKRVVDLERQHSEFNMEWQSVEVRVSELVDIVGSALEDHHI